MDTQDILCEFFEIAIHNILYKRKLYPESIFIKRKKYGIIIFEAEHPQLKEYIREALKAVQFHANANLMKRLFICISSAHKEIEKYVFDVIQMQNNLTSDPGYLKLEQNLRTFFLKLHTLDCNLNTLPYDSTFTIKIHTTEYSSLAFNEDPNYADFPWINISGSSDTTCKKIFPLHTIDTDHLTLQVYIESN